MPVSLYLADGLVDGCSPLDSLSIVVGDIGPPIGFSFDIAKNHILHWSRHAWNLHIYTCIYGRPYTYSLYSTTFQGIFAFQHRQPSERCCRIVRALLALTPCSIRFMEVYVVTTIRNVHSISFFHLWHHI